VSDSLDKDHPLIIDFDLDEGFSSVKNLKIKLKSQKFWSYSKAVEDGGSYTSTTTSNEGGGTIKTMTSSTAGQTSTTSGEGGGGTISEMSQAFTGDVVELGLPGDLSHHYHNMVHGHALATHSHSIYINGHEHSVNLNLESHHHDVFLNLPNHIHELQKGIYEFNELPRFDVYLDNVLVLNDVGDINIDLKNNLSYISGYHSLKIVTKTSPSNPTGLGKASVNFFIKGFARH